MKSRIRIALLIDAENLPATNFDKHHTMLMCIGDIVRTRAYADWKNSNPKSWIPLIEGGVVEKVIGQLKSFRNKADKHLIHDGSKLIQSEEIDAIAVYSRDGGFSLGAQSWKANGVKLIIFNFHDTSKELTADADILIDAVTGKICYQSESEMATDEHIYRERTICLPGIKVVKKMDINPLFPEQFKSDPIHANLVKDQIVRILKRSGGTLLVSKLGELIRLENPGFRVSDFRCKKLTVFLKTYVTEIFVSCSADNQTYWAQLKK